LRKKVANKLIDALANNTTLEYLKLHTNGYGGEEESYSLASVVARALIRNMTLRSLSISGHQVDDKCAKIIAQSLEKKYPSLISLELVEAKLSFIGGKYICSAAKNNTTLKVLRLDHNDICKNDTHENTVKSGIADLVKSNSPLIELSAMGNDISIEEYLDILEGLKCNNSLESLNIHENDYDDGDGQGYTFTAENSARYLQIAQEISNSNNTIIQTHGISDGYADEGISGDSVWRKMEERNYRNKQLRNATLISLLLPQFYSETSSLRLREKRSIEG
jgi:Ran GTPase-activating protein (RanGAP) involved in mRNA processing and transport